MTSDDYKSVDTVKQCLGSIARLGRAAWVHIALACQRASGGTISSDLKGNIQLCLLLGAFDDGASNLMFDKDISNLAKSIPGRGYMKVQAGNPTEIQTYWTQAFKDWEFDEDQKLTYNNPEFKKHCKHYNKDYDALNTGWVEQKPLDSVDDEIDEDEEDGDDDNNDMDDDNDIDVSNNKIDRRPEKPDHSSMSDIPDKLNRPPKESMMDEEIDTIKLKPDKNAESENKGTEVKKNIELANSEITKEELDKMFGKSEESSKEAIEEEEEDEEEEDVEEEDSDSDEPIVFGKSSNEESSESSNEESSESSESVKDEPVNSVESVEEAVISTPIVNQVPDSVSVVDQVSTSAPAENQVSISVEQPENSIPEHPPVFHVNFKKKPNAPFKVVFDWPKDEKLDT